MTTSTTNISYLSHKNTHTHIQSLIRPTWSLTQAAVHWVDAALGLQAAGRHLGQVAAEAGVAWLAGQPLQAAVGEG